MELPTLSREFETSGNVEGEVDERDDDKPGQGLKEYSSRRWAGPLVGLGPGEEAWCLLTK